MRYNPFKKPLPTSAPAPELHDVSKLELIISKLAGWMGFGRSLSDLATTKRPYQRQPGPGYHRAKARLAAKREANKLIPTIEREPSRQVVRRSTIMRGKQVMTIAREEAKKRKIKGGSALIRTPADVDAVLG